MQNNVVSSAKRQGHLCIVETKAVQVPSPVEHRNLSVACSNFLHLKIRIDNDQLNTIVLDCSICHESHCFQAFSSDSMIDSVKRFFGNL